MPGHWSVASNVALPRHSCPQPCASGKSFSVDSFKGSPRDARWSAPVFLSLNGLSSGFTMGMQRADLLIG